MVEEKKFRKVMGHFPTGVTVVTARERGGTRLGLTVSAFTSVSLSPVRILVCLHKEATAHDPITGGVSFAVNILSADQEDLAWRFASGPPEERFDGLENLESPGGNPLIPGSVGWLDCVVKDVYPGGDHSVVLAEVTDCEAQESEPLLFHRGQVKRPGW